jgi:dihydroorotase
MNAILFSGARIIDPARGLDQIGDILVADGKVLDPGPKITSPIPKDTQIINLSGLVLCPGLIDIHAHLREPGQTAKETIATGTRAAARGGFTSIVCMPNTSPVIDNSSTVAHVLETARRTAVVNVFVAGAITKGLAGEELAPIGSLKSAGVVALSDDGHCVQNNEIMRRAAEYAKMFSLPLLDHCQDYSLVTDGVMNEGYWSTLLGLRGWPAVGEQTIVARNILLAELTGTHFHCQHLSSTGSIKLIKEAKKQGLPISAEACPHYLALTDSALAGSEEFWKNDGQTYLKPFSQFTKPAAWPRYDTNFKVNPPIRTASDRQSILEAVADGTIEIIATDHAPHTNDEKTVEFDYAPFGVIGLETAFAISLNMLYHSRMMDLSDLIARFTTGPARLLALQKGSLHKGADADVTVFDPDQEWIYTRESSLSKSANSPFFGWPMKGKVLGTWVNGKQAWQAEEMNKRIKQTKSK